MVRFVLHGQGQSWLAMAYRGLRGKKHSRFGDPLTGSNVRSSTDRTKDSLRARNDWAAALGVSR